MCLHVYSAKIRKRLNKTQLNFNCNVKLGKEKIYQYI